MIYSVGEPEIGDSGEGLNIFGVEIAEPAKKLHGGSSQGVDQIHT